ncbi:hypothetical protein D3C80_749820 [compost metagenome]
MREGLGQLADAGQAAVQHFFAQVVELQQYVVLVRAHAVAGDDFLDHGTGDHVAAGQVLGVRCVTLHEALAVGVDQVTAFTAATFGDQYTGAGDAGRVELPHFDVLHRHAGTQGHAHAVAGVDQGVGGGGVDTAGTAGGQDHGLGTDVDGFAGLDADGDDADDGAVLVLHQVNGVPLVEERGAALQVGLVQGVQQGVTGTVGRGAGTGGLATLAEVLGLATERTLIDAALLGTGERQAHVFQLEHGFRTDGAHVFDGVLVTDVVGTLDGVVHVPAPIVVRVGRSDGAGDAALGGNGVGTGREDLGHHGGLVAALGQLQRGAHAGAAATYDDGVERKSTNARHGSHTPENLHAPDEEREHRNAAYRLEQETHDSRRLAQRHGRQVVGGDGPHADPGVNAQGDQGQQAEDAHRGVGEQTVPLGIGQTRIEQQVAQQEEEISRENDRRNALGHPVIKARTREVRDVGYHTHTPSSTISTAETTMTIFEPSAPPSSVSPTPASITRWRTPATRW